MNDEVRAKERKILDDVFNAFSTVSGGDYVSIYDVKCKLTRYSASAVQLFGLPGEYIPDGADDWSDYIHPEDVKSYQNAMAEMFTKKSTCYNLTYRVRLKEGSYAKFRFLGGVLRDENGDPDLIGGIMVNEGMTENTDPVTMLRNQYGFYNDAATLMKKDKKTLIVYMGINKMSDINVMQGYGYGNKLLGQAAWILQEELSQYGTVYRMNGSKFAFMTNMLSSEEIFTLYEKIRNRFINGIQVGDMRQEVSLNGGMISFTGNNLTYGTLISCLKLAYKESKNKMNGRLVDFDGSADARTAELKDIIKEIRISALKNFDGFSLNYQPVMDLETEEIIGIESLLRWESKKHGTVPPSAFIPILSDDLIFEEIGYWIIKQAMTEGHLFLEKNPNIIIGVNIARIQLEDNYFAKEIEELSEQTGFPLQNLCLELSKDCRTMECNTLKRITSELKKIGVKILIDDFGSGHASIDFLRELSPDFIKFDMKYVSCIEESEQDRNAVKFLAELAAVYSSRTCLKGIENNTAKEIIKQYNIKDVQGFFHSQPSPANEIIEKFF